MTNIGKHIIVAAFLLISTAVYATQEEDFFIAIDRGDTKTMANLISKGVSVNAVDDMGWSALHRAVFANNTNAIKLLLSNKNINIEAMLPEDTELKITGGDVWYADGETPLHLAAFKGYTDIVNILLDNNADILAIDKVDDAMAIHIAAAMGNTKTVLALLDSKAAKNSGINLVDAEDDSGVNPLMWATMKNQIPTMTQLIRYGASIEATDEDGWTPLHFAAAVDSYKAVELLLKAGANPKAEDNDGNVPADLTEDTNIENMLNAAAMKK